MPLPQILPLRQQAAIRNEWLTIRLNTLLPQLMARENVDMWLVIAREYNEDPTVMTLLPEPAMSARRRTILVFVRNDSGTMDRFTVSRYGMPGFYESIWNPDEEEQYACLARIIRDYDPQSIAINTSQTFAFSDGLTQTEYDSLVEALGAPYASCLQSGERLAVGWLEARIPQELTVYPRIIALGHAIIAEAFSTEVIHPGITTTEDVVWWMRQRMSDHGLQAWFQPDVAIQAPGQSFEHEDSPRTRILPGDLLWCDMGFMYLGLATDQQQHAYVLRPGETDAPDGLKTALAQGNQLQDILMAEMRIGRTGNEVLASALNRAHDAGLTPSIYTHPLGYHGHAAGPTIGLWDRQNGVPGNGDYPLFENTCYSIELNIKANIPEWQNQEVRFALEEDAVLVNGKMQWLDGRQTNLYLIG